MTNTANVRDHRAPGHFWADNEIVDVYLPTIGIYGFAVYMLLAKHADSKTGQCDPSIEGMARKLGVSAPTVRKALDVLKDQGLITIRHRRRERDGKLINQTSIYTILAIKKQQIDAPGKPSLVGNEVDQVVNVVDQGGKGDLPGVVNQVSSNNTHKNNTHRTREREVRDTPARTPVVQAYFELLPGNTLTAAQVQKINETVTDLVQWRNTLEEWALNGWNPQRVGKIIDRYSSGRTARDDRPGGTQNGHKPADSRPALEPFKPAADKPDQAASIKALGEVARRQLGWKD